MNETKDPLVLIKEIRSSLQSANQNEPIQNLIKEIQVDLEVSKKQSSEKFDLLMDKSSIIDVLIQKILPKKVFSDKDQLDQLRKELESDFNKKIQGVKNENDSLRKKIEEQDDQLKALNAGIDESKKSLDEKLSSSMDDLKNSIDKELGVVRSEIKINEETAINSIKRIEEKVGNVKSYLRCVSETIIKGLEEKIKQAFFGKKPLEDLKRELTDYRNNYLEPKPCDKIADPVETKPSESDQIADPVETKPSESDQIAESSKKSGKNSNKKNK